MTRIIVFVFLFCGLAAQAQDGIIERVTQQLRESKARFPGMKPFLFFSQDKYAPGDTAFFRLFILAEDQKIVADRTIFTVELFDQLGVRVLGQHIPSEKVGVANQLILPKTLEPGLYTIRVFSDRMTENYGQVQELVITGDHRLERLSTKPAIEVFPEGGHVVAGGVTQLILRRLGTVGNCELFSRDGKIASIGFNDKGYGSTQFLPKLGESYWIEYNDAGKKESVPVLMGTMQQMALRVYPGPNNRKVLDIGGSLDMRKEKVFLILIAQRSVILGYEVKLNGEGRKQVIGAPDLFPEGFSELFLVNADGQILAYRPVYEPPNILGGVGIKGIPSEVGLREDIRVNLKVTDDKGNPIDGAFAVSVINGHARTKPTVTPDPSLILQSKRFRVDWSGSRDEVEMELLSNQIPEQLYDAYESIPNSTSLRLRGRAYYKDPNLVLPYNSTIVIYLHRDLIRYESTIAGDGSFYFPKIYDFLGNDLLYYKVLDSNKELNGVSIDWSTQYDSDERSPRRDALVSSDLPDEYGVLRKQKMEIDKSYSFFLKTPLNQDNNENPNASLEDEFQEADVTIFPKDYTPFETMQELILEVIPMLEFRKHQKDSTVRVTLLSKSIFVAQRYANGNPLFVIDGWMTSDMGYLMRLSPREIVSFKIINDIGKLDRLGSLASNGVLFIHTRDPERTRVDLTKKLFPLNGMSPTLSFCNQYPVDKRIPDLRSNLYWNPQIRTDEAGTAHFDFRTSDIPGEYTVRLMGILSNGNMIATEHTFNVKFKK